jgi:phosphopantothenoylcysteine decarboxylase/phosphopantothenate--cysteine ligase
MAAAVSDFKPATFIGQKQKKGDIEQTLELVENPDILKWLGSRKKESQILIGFAMETENLLENAQKKLRKKNLDWICANDLNDPDGGFDSEMNTLLLISHDQEKEYSGSKTLVASNILKEIFSDS